MSPEKIKKCIVLLFLVLWLGCFILLNVSVVSHFGCYSLDSFWCQLVLVNDGPIFYIIFFIPFLLGLFFVLRDILKSLNTHIFRNLLFILSIIGLIGFLIWLFSNHA